MPISNLSVYTSGLPPVRRIRLPKSLLECSMVWAAVAAAICSATLLGACGPRYSGHDAGVGTKPPDKKSECLGPELSEGTIRSIGFAAVRNKDPELPPTPPSNIHVTPYECNYLYTETFAPEAIGGSVTVVISREGRVLDILPSF